MIYTVITESGQSYDLPPKTLKVVESIEKVANLNKTGKSLREKYRVLFDCLVQFLGKENLKEIFGTDSFEECDLSDISILYQKILNAYNKPEEEFQLKETLKTFDSIPVEKITSFANAATKLKDFK